ncbi:MAG: 5-formyltetrahydrofolate cyclo-ligase [Congregibacter sp.]
MLTSKSDWRKVLRQRRTDIPADTAANAERQAAAHLQATRLWADAEHVGLYLANDGELNAARIARIAAQSEKTLYLPVIDGQSMHFAAWDPRDPLKNNRYGIGEPIGERIHAQVLDLLLLPLVGFTQSGYRLGMGGGYYDRFFAAESQFRAHKLGLAYTCQRENDLESFREEWDIDLDSVLTECGIFAC